MRTSWPEPDVDRLTTMARCLERASEESIYDESTTIRVNH